jgi:RNA polymerase sigma-70 factor (ECF subfamily)
VLIVVSTHSAASHEDVRVLYATSYRRLVGVVALAAGTRADAEECVQEAFVRLLGAWDKVAGYEDPEAWVRTVAFRLLSNRRRKARNGALALIRHRVKEHAAGPSSDSVDIARALQLLPTAQRQVVVLHYLLGYTGPEIAEVLAVPEGTVKSRLSRARTTLQPLLVEEKSSA